MASWNTHGRDPLLDSNLHQLLQKRGRELLGLGFVVIAVIISLMLGSYAPSDPSWMASTDMPVKNSLGRIGAAMASPLMIIIGMASWGLVVFFGGWGLRLLLGRGHEHALSRAVFVPIALAVSAVWCATLVPAAGWDTIYGMGGVFGDTVLAAVVNALPMSPGAGVTFMGVAMLFATLAVWGFVLGVDRFELLQFARYVIAGVVLCYAGLLLVLRGGVGGGVKSLRVAGGAVARKVQDGRAAHAAARDRRAMEAYEAAQHYEQEQAWAEAQYAHPEPVIRSAPAPVSASRQEPAMRPAPAPRQEPVRRGPPVIRASSHEENFDLDQDAFDEDLYEVEAAPYTAPMRAAPVDARQILSAPPRHVAGEDASAGQGNGLLAKLKALSGRGPEPAAPDLRNELVEPPLSASALQAQPPGDMRIKTRIADAIRHRKSAKPVLKLNRAQFPISEPPLRAARPVAAVPDMAHPAPVAPAGFQASLTSAPLAAVPMPDWMLATRPVSEAAPAPVAWEAAPVAPHAPVMRDPVPEDTGYFVPDENDMHPAPEPQRSAHVLQRRVVPTAPRKVMPSRQAQAEAQPALQFEPRREPVFELPPLSLLESPSNVQRYTLSDEALEENARMLEAVLDDYGVRGEIVSVRPGPVVTQYELEPAPGLKASRVIGLADDIARSMSALSARVSTVPGRSIIGIELPNVQREKVVLREILSARDYGDSNMRLPLALGKAIDGEPIVANLAKMPHLLIAGTTGSGKSVAINTMILSLLYRLPPEECRMIMIDPKMLELSVYDGIPHLLSPVVTDPKKAVVALKWVVGEMEERYRKMSKMGVRNIEGYNGRVREALDKGEMFKRTIQTGFDDETGDPVFETEEFAPEVLPFIVVVVDEMADLMMVAGKEIEACIQRLAQMARASGIHIIMATQRPSVDVITGTIKANFPTRISFQVTSKIDSRTILGEQGAEQLLGMGDMLYMAGGGRVSRIHGPFVSDEEVEEVVNHLKSFGPPDYKSGVVDGPESDKEADIDAVLGLGGNTTGEDALYDQAVQVVIQDRKCSTSYIQRKLGIGYNKAARLVEQMEDEGLVTPANHVGKREILVPEQG
ncbi:MAG: DNA translocase FtsK 4TM domain-containing protein [Natronohydrobacter sp.]|nr:DNA translocase FtsK 4TM domain-containing protein [Natronohydrobacter sp.]MCC5964493.1 DNA translocase FtsK 4TM domain-containing protein [Natronohydrobacter sp.]